MREVTLQEVLSAREERVRGQNEMLSKFGKPLVSFTMNIAGPVKNSPMIRAAFYEGRRMLDMAFEERGITVLEERLKDEVTGCELLYAVSVNPARSHGCNESELTYGCNESELTYGFSESELIKQICVSVEEGTQLGRLVDIDVISSNGAQLKRATERKCLICGRAGKGCASRRVHSAEELQKKTREIITEYFKDKEGGCAQDGTGHLNEATCEAAHEKEATCKSASKAACEAACEKETTCETAREVAREVVREAARVSEMVTSALVEEVLTTPKPGLVDRNNNGSHTDMDVDTFMVSAAALKSYWAKCFVIGFGTREELPEATFKRLREEGLKAEEKMFKATEGVNTHMGAIFLIGTVCGAAGRLWSGDTACGGKGTDPSAIAEECAKMTRKVMERELEALSPAPGRGARGEIADGLPGVTGVGLPVFRDLLSKGADRNAAGAGAFIALVARGTDTNMVRRGGAQLAEDAAGWAAALVDEDELLNTEMIESLDERFIEHDLSPGGCADLLAITYFLSDYCE